MFTSDHCHGHVDFGTISNTFTGPVSDASHRILLKSPGLPDYVRTLELPKPSKFALTAAFQTAPNPDARVIAAPFLLC
jgi:hypothetical protein